MMDLSETGSQSKTTDIKQSDGNEETLKKSCADCGTTKTPLWRGGPAGPKSLCNACGIRSRKKRRALLGLKQGGGTDVRKIKKSKSSSSSRRNNEMDDPVKRKMLGLGRREVMLQRPMVEKQRKKNMGEEEQAAILLMALSMPSWVGLGR